MAITKLQACKGLRAPHPSYPISYSLSLTFPLHLPLTPSVGITHLCSRLVCLPLLRTTGSMEWWDVLSSIDWHGVGTTAWGWGSWAATGAGKSSLALLATLPRECKLAWVHATAICSGEDPAYYSTPGFGPITVSYGWLLLGVVVGVVMSMQVMLLCTRTPLAMAVPAAAPAAP
eukprot:4265588-Pyramimonas_sp.AAC.1